MTVKEQEEFIICLANKFQKISEENMMAVSFRACRILAMVANTEYQKLLTLPNERPYDEH